MSEIGGPRTNPTQTSTIRTPNGMAQVMRERISSVECPTCGIHIRAGHRPNIYCRSCKREITVDTEYRFLRSNNRPGITSHEWSWHNECYDESKVNRELGENRSIRRTLKARANRIETLGMYGRRNLRLFSQ